MKTERITTRTPMTMQTITLSLPGHLYSQLQLRAERAHRTVEAELLEVVATAVPATEELSPDLAEAIAPLELLDDEALWRAARSHLPSEAAQQMEQLHLRRQATGLTTPERDTLTQLTHQYERYMLVRAQATALLKQRGHDVASLRSASV